MEKIERLLKLGNLIVAGPLATNELSYRGLFIFQYIKSERFKILSQDAVIKIDLFEYDILDWYGSSAPLYSKKIWKLKP